MTMDLASRAKITDATVARWRDVPFRWGKADCSRLAATHLKAMGHGKSLPKLRPYRNALGAARTLRGLGVASIAAYLDAMPGLIRLPSPAFALTGDIVELPGEDDMGAICIYLGNGACLGWHPDAEGCAVLANVSQWNGAWRV